jgi:protein ImuA
MTMMSPLAAFARRPVLPRGMPAANAAARWRPGPEAGSTAAALHGEVFARADEVSGAALALAFALDRLRSQTADPCADLLDQRPWLWVQDAASLRQTGRPYRPGLPVELRHRLIHVTAKSAEDALFALEEGLRCRDLAFVVGEIAGNPKALNFTAARRLSLAVEKHGTPLWLVRLDAAPDLSSARQRWQAKAAPSQPPRWDDHAPGSPAWHAQLFRARAHPPGQWILRDDGRSLTAAASSARAPDHGDLADGAGDRSLAAG